MADESLTQLTGVDQDNPLARMGAGVPGAWPGTEAPPTQAQETPKPAANQFQLPPKLQEDLSAAQREKTSADERIAKQQGQDISTGRARMDRAWQASSADLDKMPGKWDADAEWEKRKHSPIEQFGSLASVIGIMASAFTHQPVMNALNASAAAMNALNAGDKESYDRAESAFKENSNLFFKRHEMQREAYHDAVEIMKTNMELGTAQARTAAVRFDDKKTQAYLDAGLTEEWHKWKMQENAAADKWAQLQPRLIETTMRGRAAVAMEAARKEVKDATASGDPERIKKAQQQLVEAQTQVQDIHSAYDRTVQHGVAGVGGDAGNQEAMSRMGWTPDAIDAAARTYNKTGKMPQNLGTRQFAGMISGQIQNRATELLKEDGKTPEQRTQDWQKYGSQKVAISRFESGPQGNTIRSLNVVVDHLYTLKELGHALNNGDIPRFNALAQHLAEETGNPAPTNFDEAKSIVGPELIKSLGVAGAGTEKERTAAGEQFNRARGPKALEGAIDTAQKLLRGQLGGLRRQFKVATGLPESEFDDMLEPRTKEFFKVGTETKKDTDGWEDVGGVRIRVKP